MHSSAPNWHRNSPGHKLERIAEDPESALDLEGKPKSGGRKSVLERHPELRDEFLDLYPDPQAKLSNADRIKIAQDLYDKDPKYAAANGGPFSRSQIRRAFCALRKQA